MIAHLEGKVRHKTPDFIIIDVHGVGYCVHVPLSTYYDLPEPGQNVCLNIHTHVRDDALQLYGFRSLAEKEMFLMLITISGIGPRLAVNILSGISAEELRQVIYHENRARLHSIPGVGKKTAERIILELRDKLKIKQDGPSKLEIMACELTVRDDAFSALLNLGYRPVEAEKALQRVEAADGESLPLPELLKKALSLLAH
jgi:Holliday junction DNA helicase RuvA